MPIDKIIILEDDLVVRRSLEDHLRNRRCEVTTTDTLSAALEYLTKDDFDLLMLDLHVPDGDGIELLKALQGRPRKPLTIVMTGFGSMEAAVECMKNGAFDYLTKPFSTSQLDVTLKRAQEFIQLVRVTQLLSHGPEENDNELLGQSSAIEELRSLIHKVARTNATVLIQGECGTGKELVARAIHRESARQGAPFLKINCAAGPEVHLESEFFGCERGAHAGATEKREGRLELARGGTVLLDEISEIPPTIQARLLRVLQEGLLERVGGRHTFHVDVRVIATTSRHLEENVARKEFLPELFFRLNIVPIHVPPLREHPEDIVFLADHFLKRHCRRHGVRAKELGTNARAALLQHNWPGNVRELQNRIEHAVILSRNDGVIQPEHLGLAASAAEGPAAGAGGGVPTASAALPSLAELEARHILVALDHCKGNRTQAAKVLGISIRTLRNKLHKPDSPSAPTESPSGPPPP